MKGHFLSYNLIWDYSISVLFQFFGKSRRRESNNEIYWYYTTYTLMCIYFYNFLIVLITTFWYQVFMRFFLNKRKYLYFNNVLSILIYNLFPSFGQFYNRMFIKISIFPQNGIIPQCCFNCIILLANWPT